MKKLYIVLLAGAIIIAALFAGRDLICEFATEKAVSFAIGAPVHIGHFKIDRKEQTVYIKDFFIYNPKGFPRGILLDVPDIKVVYAKPFFVKRQIQLLHVVADIKEVVAIKRKDGQLNVDHLKGVQEAANLPEIGKDKNVDEGKRVHIDTLTLSIGQVVSKDYTVKAPPKVDVYDVKIKNRNYQDIPGVQTLVILMVQEAMTTTAIKGAAIYGVVATTGLAFWPVGVAAIVISKDSAEATVTESYEDVFASSVKTLEGIGKVEFQDAKKGTIKASSKGSSISVSIRAKEDNTVKIQVSARDLILPAPKYARSVLYQITDNLKKSK